ncbi:type II toxin-antitoxin system RelE family toxin (plasmid) [Ralstonia sp. 25C]|uniref:type II toxin-antitoxin system RelE family toxin n=1 Tax=Ralstonia sp. 25C TaxID=3447363 RepID=UPI003F74F51E
MHAIEFTKQAAQALKTMPRNVAATAVTIGAKIDALAVDPYAPNPNAKKLAGREGYRLRVADWRVLYQIEDGRVVIVVLAIKPRGGAYK